VLRLLLCTGRRSGRPTKTKHSRPERRSPIRPRNLNVGRLGSTKAMLRRREEAGAAGARAVHWPAGVSSCRPCAAAQLKPSRAVRTEQRWFLQSLLVNELHRDGTSTDADLERVQTDAATLKEVVDAELESEEFGDHLQFVVDAAATGSATQRVQRRDQREAYCGALVDILGFCDEATAHKALGLLKESSASVRDFADAVGALLEHEGTAAGEVCRRLQALLWLQKASGGDLITGLGHTGAAIAALLECGLSHSDPACRARAADVLLQAGLHAREREASDATLLVLCRSALFDAANRPFLLSAAWDLLLVHPNSGSAELAAASPDVDDEGTTALALLMGFLRFDQDNPAEVEAACVTALGASKLVMEHTDSDATEVIQCRLNAALVQCRRLDQMRAKAPRRGGGAGAVATVRAPQAGKDKDASPLRMILEEFEQLFKLRCERREREAAETSAAAADADGIAAAGEGEVETYDSRIANALTWLVVEHLCNCDLSASADGGTEQVRNYTPFWGCAIS
jgi:hypothetical protein